MTLMHADHNPPRKLLLPPGFTLDRVAGDAFGLACGRAADAGAPGSLLLAEREAALDLAVLLAPDRPAGEARVALPLALLALAAALAAIGPPQKPILLAWPDGLVLDGARVGAGRLAMAEVHGDLLPAWLVVGLWLQLHLSPGAGEPGHSPGRTALFEEGFGVLEPLELVEAFARHLLYGLHRLETEGPGAIAADLQARLLPPGPGHWRIDPASFDLHEVGPPARRLGFVKALGLEEVP